MQILYCNSKTSFLTLRKSNDNLSTVHLKSMQLPPVGKLRQEIIFD